MTDRDIVDVTEADFEQEVLAYSHNVPVLVDFWAEWCHPCAVLTPLLEKLAKEGHGGIRLARVNVDVNKNLSIRYGVRSIPTVKAFMKGQVTAEFTGMQPEPKLREFIRLLAPSPSDLNVEKGVSLIREHRWRDAEVVFEEVLSMDDGNTQGLYGLLTCLVAEGRVEEASKLIQAFPASHEYALAQTFLPLIEAYTQLEKIDFVGESEISTTYWNSLRLAQRGNILAGLDGLLEVLRRNKQYGNGSARKVFVALLQLLGEEHPDARQYRAELASILF